MTSQPTPEGAGHSLGRVDCVSKRRCLKIVKLWSSRGFSFDASTSQREENGKRQCQSCPEVSYPVALPWLTPVDSLVQPPRLKRGLTAGQPTQANRVTFAHTQPELACGAQRAGRAVGGELARNKIPNKATHFA